MNVTVLYDETTLQKRVQELAVEIDAYAQLAGIEKFVMVIVLKGAAMFAMDLSRHIKTPHVWEFIRAKSYISTGNNSPGKMISSGKVEITDTGYKIDLKDKDVIVVEDIVDTGLTMTKLVEKLKKEAKTVNTCTLLDKPSGREHKVKIDFTGFTLEGSPFVLGYGLDVDEYYRNLPYIGVNK